MIIPVSIFHNVFRTLTNNKQKIYLNKLTIIFVIDFLS